MTEHPVERAEREAKRRTDALIAQYLSRPKTPTRHDFSDHAWRPRTLTCARCGVTLAEFYNVEFGLGTPCRK